MQGPGMLHHPRDARPPDGAGWLGWPSIPGVAEHPAGKSYQGPSPFTTSANSILKKAKVPTALPAVPTPAWGHEISPMGDQGPAAPSRARNEGRHHELPAPTCSACRDVGQHNTRFPTPGQISGELSPILAAPVPQFPPVTLFWHRGPPRGWFGEARQEQAAPAPASSTVEASGRGVSRGTPGGTLGHTNLPARPCCGSHCRNRVPAERWGHWRAQGRGHGGLPRVSGSASPHSPCLSPPVPAGVSPVPPPIPAARPQHLGPHRGAPQHLPAPAGRPPHLPGPQRGVPRHPRSPAG